MKLLINNYPELKLIAWNRKSELWMTGKDAFSTYERNWQYVDENALSDRESTLIVNLKKKYGKGVLNV